MHYYVYRITCSHPNSIEKYYYGYRSSKLLPKDDNYWSSSKYVIDAIKKYGSSFFTKKIVKIFSTLDLLNDYIGKPIFKYRDEYSDLENLRRLYFDYVYSNLTLNNLPQNLEVLYLPSNFNHSVDNLPKTLKDLRFRGSFNQTIDNLPLEIKLPVVSKYLSVQNTRNLTIEFLHAVADVC